LAEVIISGLFFFGSFAFGELADGHLLLKVTIYYCSVLLEEQKK
jgi:hypothetical protein